MSLCSHDWGCSPVFFKTVFFKCHLSPKCVSRRTRLAAVLEAQFSTEICLISVSARLHYSLHLFFFFKFAEFSGNRLESKGGVKVNWSSEAYRGWGEMCWPRASTGSLYADGHPVQEFHRSCTRGSKSLHATVGHTPVEKVQAYHFTTDEHCLIERTLPVIVWRTCTRSEVKRRKQINKTMLEQPDMGKQF